jgi:hypothetical protein
MLLMTSLFEGRTDGFLHTRVAALLPAKVLKETMRRVYADFHERHAGDYCEEAFKMEFGTGSGQRGPKSGVMLDSGFAIYILFRQVRLQLPQRVRHCVASTLSKRTGSRRGALRAPGTQIMERSNGFGAVVRPSAEEYKAHEERANADALDPLKRLRSGVRVIPPLAHDDCR